MDAPTERTSSTASSKKKKKKKSNDDEVRDKNDDFAELRPFFMEERLRTDRQAAMKQQMLKERKGTLKAQTGLRSICFKIAENAIFQSFFNLVIFVNVIMVIIEANLDVTLLLDPDDAYAAEVVQYFDILNRVFMPLFAIEVLVRILGTPLPHWWKDTWVVLDTCVVIFGLIDDVVLAIFLKNRIGGITALRCLRIVRVFRLGRLISVLGRVKTLAVVASVMSQTAIQAFWMIALLCTFNWCVAIFLTVLTGSNMDAFAEFDFGAIIREQGDDVQMIGSPGGGPDEGGPDFNQTLMRAEMLGSMAGSLLLLFIMPLRLMRWGPGIVWQMIMSDIVQMQVAGLVLLMHTAVNMTCIMSIVSGVFICQLRESANREREKSLVEGERLAKLTINDLMEVFEEFADPKSRTMDVAEFKHAVKKNPRLVVNAEKGEHHNLDCQTDACFHELDVCNNHRISLPEFVVGVLKLTRVKPQPEFITQEEHQHRVLRTTKKVSDCYKAGYKITSRYLDDFKEQARGLQESCINMKKTLDPAGLGEKDDMPKESGVDAQPEEKLEDVTASKFTRLEKQLEARYSFISRLKILEDKIQPSVAERQMWKDDRVSEHLHPLMESILHEDVLPWVRDQMPAMQESWQKQAAAKEAAERKAPRAKAKPKAVAKAPPIKGMGSAPPISAMPASQKDVQGMGSALPSSALRMFKPS